MAQKAVVLGGACVLAAALAYHYSRSEAAPTEVPLPPYQLIDGNQTRKVSAPTPHPAKTCQIELPANWPARDSFLCVVGCAEMSARSLRFPLGFREHVSDVVPIRGPPVGDAGGIEGRG
jgi:hypothetical protein